jgi:hypothetical protein
MEIKRIHSSGPDYADHSLDESHAADAASAVLGVRKKKVKIKRSKIKDIASGLAEVAYSLGETNNPEEYAELMTEDILKALQSLQTVDAD